MTDPEQPSNVGDEVPPSAAGNSYPRSDGEIIVRESENVYEAYDAKYRQELFAFEKLDADVYISINVQTRGPNGLRNPNLRGAVEVAKILDKFGPRARGIRTTLERDTLQQFHDYMLQNPGAPLEEGVKGTWAYDRNAAAGFDQVTVLRYVPDDVRPEDSVLQVLFTREQN